MILFLGSTCAEYKDTGLELDKAAHSTPPRHTPVQTHPAQQAAGLMVSGMLEEPPYPSVWETLNHPSFLSAHVSLSLSPCALPFPCLLALLHHAPQTSDATVYFTPEMPLLKQATQLPSSFSPAFLPSLVFYGIFCPF